MEGRNYLPELGVPIMTAVLRGFFWFQYPLYILENYGELQRAFVYVGSGYQDLPY